jgi:hydroxymethylpyrimidine/phosphomethylpyrimidine kinase
MNVSKDMIEPEQDNMVENEDLWDIYNEVLDNCRKDRVAVDEVLVNFIDMVMNEGDASSASKEAIVNLLKIKSDSADKMSKIADLMTRIKLKERDTFPRYLAAQQNNKVVIEGSKREMIKSINKLAAKKKLTASRTNNDQAN